MTKFQKIKSAYRDGAIDKAAFCQAMFEEHTILFDYAKELRTGNISELKINTDGVIAVFRDPTVSMYCSESDVRSVPIETFNFGAYERDEIQLMRKLVAAIGGAQAAFFDIGANYGYYSLALSRYFPGIKGVAFEPVPSTFALLERNFALNEIEQIKVCNVGLSDQNGELVFYTYLSQSGASSMTRNLDSADVREIRCSVTMLDDYCKANGVRADFIKCDVEGAELFVFRGAESFLAASQPVILTEMLRKWCAKYSYHPNDLIDFFRQLGYGCFVVVADRLKSCVRVTEETRETNYVFLHLVKHRLLIGELAENAEA